MRIDHRLTRTLSLALIAAGPMVAIGCQQAPSPPRQSQPLVIDEAMQKRDWSQSSVYVANGNVESGSTRSRFTPETNDDSYNSSTAGTYQEGATQFAGGLLNVLFLPISRIFQPFNASETSNGGITMEPSFTGITPPAAPEPGTLGNTTNPPSPGNPQNAPPGSGTPAPGATNPPGAGQQGANPGTPPGADNPTGGAGGSTPAGGDAGTGVIK